MSLRGGPDLVSKLREVIAKVKPLVEKATPMPWSTNSQFIPQASAKILVGSDRRSIAYVGMNPQSKEWETYAQDITNTLLIIAAVNAMDELESLLGLEGQAALCDHKRKAFYLGPDGSEFCVCGFKKFGPRSTVEKQPSPSTPIVTGTPNFKRDADVVWPIPGTAGLSAEQVKSCFPATSQTQSDAEWWSSCTDRLNALLAAKPAECSQCQHYAKELIFYEGLVTNLKTEFKQREARIRKDVLEEAAQVIEKDCDMWKPQNLDKPIWSWKDMAANHRSMSSAIRALAERPAPAGEVKGKKS